MTLCAEFALCFQVRLPWQCLVLQSNVNISFAHQKQALLKVFKIISINFHRYFSIHQQVSRMWSLNDMLSAHQLSRSISSVFMLQPEQLLLQLLLLMLQMHYGTIGEVIIFPQLTFIFSMWVLASTSVAPFGRRRTHSNNKCPEMKKRCWSTSGERKVAGVLFFATYTTPKSKFLWFS